MENEEDENEIEMPRITAMLLMLYVMYKLPTTLFRAVNIVIDPFHSLTSLGWTLFAIELILSLISLAGVVMIILYKKIGVYVFALPLIVGGVMNVIVSGNIAHLIPPLINMVGVFLLLFLRNQGKSVWKMLE